MFSNSSVDLIARSTEKQSAFGRLISNTIRSGRNARQNKEKDRHWEQGEDLTFAATSSPLVYFRNRLLAKQDRLGSIGSYDPYGDDKTLQARPH